MDVTIKLADTVSFKRAGHEMAVDMGTIPAHILAELVAHGIAQTVGDAASAASSAVHEAGRKDGDADWKALPKKDKAEFTTRNAGKIADFGKSLMEKRLERLQAGEWQAARSSGAGLSDVEERLAKFCVARMTFEKGTKTADRVKQGWEKYCGLPQDKRDAIKALVEEEMEQERIAAQKAAAIKIDLTDF